jgi:hypothetical protein
MVMPGEASCWFRYGCGVYLGIRVGDGRRNTRHFLRGTILSMPLISSGEMQCRARPSTTEPGQIGQVEGQCYVSFSWVLLRVLVSSANAHSRGRPALDHTLCVAERTSVPVRYPRILPANLRPREVYSYCSLPSPFSMFPATGEHPCAYSLLTNHQHHDYQSCDGRV